ncbi:MAG: two-component regulator propeller domain-containing protein [Gemmatimonadota bacterium]
MVPYRSRALLQLLAAGAASTLSVVPAVAQYPEIFDRADGLSHNTVFSIAEDERGFLWAGTADGLNRFDGLTFDVFRHEPQDSTSLSNNTVRRIFEDSSGRLWIRTGAGLNRLDRSSDSFVRYPIVAQEMAESPDGTFWVAALDGLYRYDSSADRFDSVEVWPRTWAAEREESGLILSGLAADSLGTLWVLRSDGALYRRPPSGPLTEALDVERRLSHFVHQIGHDAVLLGHAQGFDTLRLGTSTSPLAPPAEALGHVLSAWAHSNGSLLVGASGLFRFTPGSPRETLWLDETGGLSAVWALHEDRFGSTWAGTVHGLLRIPDRPQPSRTVAVESSSGERIGLIMSVEPKGDGGLWLGTLGTGLWRTRDDGADAHRIPGAPADVWAVHEAAGDRVWVGAGTGLYRVVDGAEARQERPAAGDTPWGTPIFALASDTLGTLWVGSATGLAWYDPTTGAAASLDRVADDQPGPVRVESFTTDERGHIWAATSGSDLYRIRPEDRSVERFRTGDVDAFFESEGLWAGAFDRAGRLWVGGDRGLALFDQADPSMRLVGAGDRVPPGPVYDIEPAEDGAFWVTTAQGLLRIPDPSGFPSTPLAPRMVDVERDMPVEFNRRAGARTPEGLFLFGADGALVLVDPSSSPSSLGPPAVVIERIDRIRSDSVVSLHPPDGATVRTPTDDAGLEVHFTAPLMAGEEGLTYSVFMDGLDPGWYDPGASHARYMNVPPGHYTFRVVATNADGVPAPVEATVAIVVPPPVWATLWFRVVVGSALFTTLVWTVRRISTRRLRAQLQAMEVERRVAGERTRISRDLHDHLGAHVSSLISGIELARLRADRGDESRLLETLDEVDVDARRTLSELRETVWSLHEDAISIDRFAERVQEDLERRGRLTTMHLALTARPSIERDLTPEEGLHLFRIVQEAVTNAVRHSGGSEVFVAIEETRTGVSITVSDNGEAGERPREGLGSRGMHERALAIGGSVRIGANASGGTSVTVEL